MRYSKKRIIVTSVISVLCFFAIVFLIVKGISDSKKITEADVSKSKLTASVSNKIVEEEKKTIVTKKESKKQSKKVTKEENKKETTTKEEHVKEVTETKKAKNSNKKDTVEVTYDTGLEGKYTVTDFKKGDKEYSKEELDELKKTYSMSLTIGEGGMASLKVLDFNRMYVVDDNYFNDGKNKIEYAKNINRIRIQIEDMNIVFEKE